MTHTGSDPDGDPSSADGVSYQWLNAADQQYIFRYEEISGATASSFRLREEEGKYVGVRIRYTDGAGFNHEVFQWRGEAIRPGPEIPLPRVSIAADGDTVM